MGQLISLVVLVAIPAVASIFIDRRWQAREQEQGSEGTESKAKSVGSKLKDWGNSLTGRNKVANLVEKFQNWVTQAKLEKGVKEWLTSFSDEEAKAFVKELKDYCAKLDVDLAWLGEEKLDNDPDLKKLLESSVASYCTTQWNVAKSGEDVVAFKTFLALQQKPNSKKNQQLYRKLFAKLVDKKVIKVDITDYLDASPKEQQKHTVELVNQAAEDNRKAFNAVLKETLATAEEDESAAEDESDAAPEEDVAAAPATA